MDFLRLPVNADDGFPQSFSMRFGERDYRVTFELSVLDDVARTEPLVLPSADAYLVMAVEREEPRAVIFRGKLVPGHRFDAAELAFVFTDMVVDPRNLNSSGTFGSRLVGGVAARWAS